MTEIKSLKCPNCGAQVSGEGEVTCAYCGSKLDIKRTGEGSGRKTEYEVTFSGQTPLLGFFRNLPAKPIDPTTTDIPFEAEPVYDNLPGGELDRRLQGNANEIIAVVEEIQKAINTEDLDLFMAQFSERDRKYYKAAKLKARFQFNSGDIKQYTISVDFLSLSAKKARIIIKSETIIFKGSGAPVPVSLDYPCQLEKQDGRWLFTDGKKVGIPGVAASVAGKGGLKIIFIIIGAFVALTVCLPISLGLIPEMYRDLDPDKRDTIDEFFKPCDNEESVGETVVVDEDRLELYAEPTTLSEHVEYVDSGMPVGIVAAREDYWLHVKLANGDEGWTHAKVHGDDINGIDEESACPSYDNTGRQNMAWVGKTVIVGQTRVEVYDRPSVGGDNVAYVSTGERLDILEAGNDFWMKVRTERGEVGWARCSFVGSHVNGKDY
ncbi:MAG: SH3 domain-containing protein [bacterium]|nr:SH3 domain-containing protein [bacterium]